MPAPTEPPVVTHNWWLHIVYGGYNNIAIMCGSNTIISHYYILVEWLVLWCYGVLTHFFEKSDFFIFFTVLFKKLIIKI